MCRRKRYAVPDETAPTVLPQPKRRRARRRITPARPQAKAERAELAELKRTDLPAFNQKSEPDFIYLICRMIAEEGPVTVREVIQEASFELDVSPSTAKRYLFKHSARRGHFCFTVDGRVDCRPHESE